MNTHFINHRVRFALGHLALSAVVVSAFVSFVLLVWYPPPLGHLEGVYPILMLLVAVDVCFGPLLTLVVASPTKPRRSLYRDLAIIGVAQFAALGYGAHSTFVARPAFIVYNADRFDVVTPGELVWRTGKAADDPRFRSIPHFGPAWAHALPPVSGQERLELMIGTVEGGPDTKNLPDLFHAWPAPSAIDAVRSRLQPLQRLESLGAAQKDKVMAELQRTGSSAENAAYVPLIARDGAGVVLLSKNDLAIIGIVAVAPPY